MTLKLRADLRRHWNKGVWPRGMPGGGHSGPRDQVGGMLGGLGDNPETIFNSPDPVGLYIRGIQALISTVPEYHAVGSRAATKTIVSNGVWNYQTHVGLVDWFVSIDEEAVDLPVWGREPAFMAKVVVELALLASKDDRIAALVRPLLQTIGCDATNSIGVAVFFRGTGAGSKTWLQTMRIMDAVQLYVIGCEGGRAYGSPAVKTEGIVAAAGAFVGSVAAVLLVG